MKNEQKKLIFILSIVVAIFTIGIISKSFQNDTFFNIAIGKYIKENGIDMKDHFSWHELSYTYPHWLYDVVIFKIYAVKPYASEPYFCLYSSNVFAAFSFISIN